MDEKMFLAARDEYANLSTEDQSAYLNQLTEKYGQDWVDAFKAFMETGDFPKFENAVKTIAELTPGVVQEGGTTLTENYERTPEQVSASLQVEHAPIYEAVKGMADQYALATPDTQEEMIEQMKDSKGEEFSETVKLIFADRDFCEYVARETQSFYDTLAKNFSEDNKKSDVITRLGDFSQSVSNGLLDYISHGRPGNGAILESMALIGATALRNFSETSDLADAIQTLGEGEVSKDAADTVAENIVKHKDNDSDNLEEKVATAAQNKETDEGADPSDEGTPASTESAPEEDPDVIREREQNNQLLDAVIEKYKGLQTQEAKNAMIEGMKQVLDPSLVEYILRRANGEDFSEDEPKEPKAEGETDEAAVSPTPEAPQTSEVEGDVDRYEDLSKKLLGEYVGNPDAAQAVVANAPPAVATLPEGAPAAVAENGVTMGENYERNELMDHYQEAGLL